MPKEESISKFQRKKTTLQRFLEMADAFVPWAEWLFILRRRCHVEGRCGRPAYSLQVMLRMCLLQVFFSRQAEWKVVFVKSIHDGILIYAFDGRDGRIEKRKPSP